MLARFEQFMQHAVEGGLQRVFSTSLQPVQVAKAAARAMEQAQVIGVSGTEVPNAYRVRLAPADLARFAEYTSSLSNELGRYLVDYAHERGLRPVAEPRVELAEDPALRAGQVRVEARFVDVAPAHRAALDEALAGTRQLRLAQVAAARPLPMPLAGKLWLRNASSASYELDPELGVVRIGRAPDNDVAIDNQRVSRYHAQARWVDSYWLVYDLGSTNGTFLDGQPVAAEQPRQLRPGSVLRLGDHDLQVVDREA